ncbi:MAG: hypothetical protein KDA79_01550 [Planctomycetaceae bacterium]|nr:hypothetical protein [Planctomycetaceae bacterium]
MGGLPWTRELQLLRECCRWHRLPLESRFITEQLMAASPSPDVLQTGIYGESPHLLSLARALVADGRFRLVRAAATGKHSGELLQAIPGLQLTDDWQELPGSGLQAVIICVPPGEDSGAIRQLATDIPRVVLLIDQVPDLTLLYELSLIRDDTGVLLLPWLPELPAVAAPVDDSAGTAAEAPLRFVQVETEYQATGGQNSGFVQRSIVEQQLLLDLLLLNRYCGDFSRISAVFSGPETGLVAHATVTLETVSKLPISWTMRAAERPMWRMQISRDAREQRLEGGQQGNTLGEERRLAWNGAAAENSGRENSSAAAIPARLAESRPVAGAAPADSETDWSRFLRTMETLDATRRSARRGRTVDLHFETTSERSQFKTHMIAVGCGLLTLTLLAVVLVLLLGEIFKPPVFVMQVARLAVFAPLAGFLLLQLLLLIARPNREEGRRRTANQPAEAEPAKNAAVGSPADHRTGD